MDELEPETRDLARAAADDGLFSAGLLTACSQAISSKRSADALERIAEALEEMAALQADRDPGVKS